MDLLGRIGVHLFEFVFFAGMLGAVSVVLSSIVEDIRELFQKDEPA